MRALPDPIPADFVPELLNIPAACRYSGFSRTAIYEMGRTRQLDFRKLHKRTFVTRASLDRLITGLPPAPFTTAQAAPKLILFTTNHQRSHAQS